MAAGNWNFCVTLTNKIDLAVLFPAWLHLEPRHVYVKKKRPSRHICTPQAADVTFWPRYLISRLKLISLSGPSSRSCDFIPSDVFTGHSTFL
jgi:hypothetical protein